MAFPKSRILSASKFIQVFKESAANKQRFCFILGSGASVDSGIPTGNQLEMQWMNELMFSDPTMAEKYADTPDDELDEGTRKLQQETETLADKLYDDDEMMHRFSDIKKAWKDALKTNGNLSSEYYFDLYKLRFHPNPQNGYRFLEELMQDKEPSLGYRVLSLLLTESNQHNLVITTNFDSLTEDALFLYSNKKPLVISHESLAAYIDSDTQRPIIAKVHRGLMFNPFNSPETTDHLEKEWHDALDYAFKTYTPVVIGYGGGDGSLMTYLQNSSSNKGIYWCFLDKYGIPSTTIQKFVKKRKGCFVSIEGFDKLFFDLGHEMFPDDIFPSATGSYLEQQMNDRSTNYDKQYKKLKDGNQNNPESAERVTTAEKIIEDKIDDKETLSFWDLLFRGDRKRDNKDYDGAITDYNAAIKLNPNISVVYLNRADCYEGKKQYNYAISDYDKAININPHNAVAYNNRGFMYDCIGDYKQSIQDFSKAIELNPLYAVAYNNRGFSYDNIKKHKQAILDYNEAIKLDPNDATAYNNRGASYDDLKEYRLAIQDYDKAIELNPSYASAYNNRGFSYNNLKEYERAIQDYNKAIELDPKDAIAYRNRGLSYIDLKDYKQSIQDFDKAIELDPISIKAYLNRAKAYRAIGEIEKAEADEAKAAELEAEEKKDNS